MTPAEFSEHIAPMYTSRALERFAQSQLGEGFPPNTAEEIVSDAMAAMLERLPTIALDRGASPLTVACGFVKTSVRAFRTAQGREGWRRQQTRSAARHATGSRAAVGPSHDEGPRLRLRSDGSLDLSEQRRSARQALSQRIASTAVNAALSPAEDIERAIRQHLGPLAASAFLARAHEGKSYAVSAKELGISADKLRQEIHRALPSIQYDLVSKLEERPAAPRTIQQRLATEGAFTRRRAQQYCEEVRQMLAAYRSARR